MPLGQEKEPPSQSLLSESTQSLITLSSLGKDTQPSSTALNHTCAFPAQRYRKKQDVIQDASLGKSEEFQFVCAEVGEGRTGGVKGQQTSSSLPRLHQLQHRNSLFCKLQTEQNPAFGTKFRVSSLGKKLTSCFDLDFILHSSVTSKESKCYPIIYFGVCILCILTNVSKI